jgi:hypothetical protein
VLEAIGERGGDRTDESPMMAWEAAVGGEDQPVVSAAGAVRHRVEWQAVLHVLGDDRALHVLCDTKQRLVVRLDEVLVLLHGDDVVATLA